MSCYSHVPIPQVGIMLPLNLRALLIIGAFLAFIVVTRKVKKNNVLIEDAVFWVVISCVFVLLALFPGIAINIAFALGFVSPSNFIYLIIIVILLWKVFVNSSEISRLKSKVNELAQEIGLKSIDEKKDAK